MTERNMDYAENFKAAGLGTLAGLFSFWLSLIPTWFGQACVTLIVSGAALVLNHFIKRELNRRWPERKRRKGDTAE
jgi:hypothetical protein